MQAEVDVFIVTKMIEECLRDRAEAEAYGKPEGHIEHVVLFTGDIDFREAINLVTGELIRKKVTIVGFRGTLSGELHSMNQVSVEYVDEICTRTKKNARISDSEDEESEEDDNKQDKD